MKLYFEKEHEVVICRHFMLVEYYKLNESIFKHVLEGKYKTSTTREVEEFVSVHKFASLPIY